MTFLVERLAELRRYLDHLHHLAPRVGSADALRADMSLRNDVLFSLQMVTQLVIDVAGELSARRGLRFEDYTSAVRNLRQVGPFPDDLVDRLARLPGFRNIVIHDYIALDYELVVAAAHDLDPIEQFLQIAGGLEL
jgi:uncharacterized protein YutE (UPF0331/DUF86 family)